MRATPAVLAAPQVRRFDHDVTNTVNVSDVADVREATRDLLHAVWPRASFDELWLAFHDFELLFGGRMPGYEGCDTVYHDIQHTLDMTLATARLIAGHEISVDAEARLGPDRAVLGILCALFHDAGYIRESGDRDHANGAELTHCHISRGAAFLRSYLPRIGLGAWASTAGEILHFTGYEKPLDAIALDDPRDATIGCLLGTGDLIAQMADRCYLEKCRDRLYLEFVLAGVAISDDADGVRRVRYQSGIDLLLQTPAFYREVVKKRLDRDFDKAYRYVEALFDGHNPYLAFIERNIAYLEHIIETGEWPALRRSPPCFTVDDDSETAVNTVNALVNRRLASLRQSPTVMATH
jgi:hypothetical protein